GFAHPLEICNRIHELSQFYITRSPPPPRMRCPKFVRLWTFIVSNTLTSLGCSDNNASIFPKDILQMLDFDQSDDDTHCLLLPEDHVAKVKQYLHYSTWE